MTRTRLLLVDDHLLFREGLSRLLAEEPDFNIEAQCSGSEHALETLRSGVTPDLVLLDFDLGEENGLAFLRGAKAAGYAGKVLVVTAGMSSGDTMRALAGGAAGCLLKHAPPAELVDAMRKVMRGESLWSPAELRRLGWEARQEDARRAPASALSARERGVLRGVFAGLANKEIAALHGISESSVKAVLQQLFSKTGVRTRAQLVRIALENHLDAEGDGD